MGLLLTICAHFVTLTLTLSKRDLEVSGKVPIQFTTEQLNAATAGCVTAHIGSADAGPKTLNIGAGVICPTQVDKHNWVGDDDFDDQYEVAQKGTEITVTRKDVGNQGWGMDLRVKCCPAPTDYDMKNVVVLFYSPWSGHCKKLMPSFITLAKAHESQEDFVFAKVDAYANHDLAKAHEVHSFPAVKYFPKQLKQRNADDKWDVDRAKQGGEVYNGPLQGGPLTVKALAKFIKPENWELRFKKPPKPPPPPPPPPEQHWTSWMSSSETFTMSMGPDGSIIEEDVETFSYRF